MPPLDIVPLSWRSIGDPIYLPAGARHWAKAYPNDYQPEGTFSFVANPDNPSQTWLTLALDRVAQRIFTFIQKVSVPSGPLPSGSAPKDIDWYAFTVSQELQAVKASWAFASLLSDRVIPTTLDCALVEKIRQDVADFSDRVHLWVGPSASRVFGVTFRTTLALLACPPSSLQVLLDRTLLRDHVGWSDKALPSTAAPRRRL